MSFIQSLPAATLDSTSRSANTPAELGGACSGLKELTNQSKLGASRGDIKETGTYTALR